MDEATKQKIASEIVSYLRENKHFILDIGVGWESTPYAEVTDDGANYFTDGIIKILDSCVQTENKEEKQA